jgi:hypothetical protein
MRRRFRPLTTFLFVLSAVLTSAAAVLWVRARNPARLDRAAFRIGQRPYALRGDPRGVSLVGLPAPGPAAGAAEARALASRLRNEQARWLGQYSGSLWEHTAQITCTVRRETRSEGWSWVPADASYGPLLDALEDPKRFVVAHHLMSEITKLPVNLTARPGGERLYLIDDHGMRVEMVPPRWDEHLDRDPDPERRRQNREDWMRGLRHAKGIQYGTNEQYVLGGGQLVAKEARVDPAQIPAVVRLWHDRVGVRYVTVPYWASVAAGLVVPALTAWRAGRAVWRRRHGRCVGCGYDLRRSPDRCPECGRPAGEGADAQPPEVAPPADDAHLAASSRLGRRAAVFVGALLVVSLVAWAAISANRRPSDEGAVEAETFAAQTRRDEQRLAELMGRVREAASTRAWRQRASPDRRWRDPVIEACLTGILKDIGQAAGRADLALPVELDEVRVADLPGRGLQSFDQNLYVVKGDDVRLDGAEKSILLVDGNVHLTRAEDCVIVARGAVTVSGGRRNLIVAGHYAEVSHDASVMPNAPTVDGSVLVSGSVLDVSHGHGSICRAPRLVRCIHARNVTFVDSPVVESFTETGCKRFRRAKFIVPAEPRAHALNRILEVTGASWPHDDKARRTATALLKPSGHKVTMRWGAEITTADGKPVPELNGWKPAMIDTGYVLLTNGEQDAEFFAPSKPH